VVCADGDGLPTLCGDRRWLPTRGGTAHRVVVTPGREERGPAQTPLTCALYSGRRAAAVGQEILGYDPCMGRDTQPAAMHDSRRERRWGPWPSSCGLRHRRLEAKGMLAAFGCGLWVGVAAGLGVVQAVAQVEHGSLGVDRGQVVKVVVGWG
jgi:hypothetical protein